MKIKRYTAASMRAALALVRAEQGADAVILSSRRGEEGIEVIAAVDYDEALFVAANRQRAAAASAGRAGAAGGADTAAQTHSRAFSKADNVARAHRGAAQRSGRRRTRATAPCSANCRICAACSRPVLPA